MRHAAKALRGSVPFLIEYSAIWESAASMSSNLTRMLALFNAFSAEHPVLKAEDIMARMGYSRGTAYRYVRELVDAGFLARAAVVSVVR